MLVIPTANPSPSFEPRKFPDHPKRTTRYTQTSQAQIHTNKSMAPPFKRRKIAPLSSQPAELTFDPSARQEYLSGFSKRKTARKEHAREQAIKRDKEEKVKERAQVRSIP